MNKFFKKANQPNLSYIHNAAVFDMYKKGLKEIFKRSPQVLYNVGVDYRRKPVVDYYQLINNRLARIDYPVDKSYLAKVALSILDSDSRFKGASGVFSRDQFDDKLEEIISNKAEFSPFYGDPKTKYMATIPVAKEVSKEGWKGALYRVYGEPK